MNSFFEINKYAVKPVEQTRELCLFGTVMDVIVDNSMPRHALILLSGHSYVEAKNIEK